MPNGCQKHAVMAALVMCTCLASTESRAGRCRLASKPYSLKTLDDPQASLTNSAINQPAIPQSSYRSSSSAPEPPSRPPSTLPLGSFRRRLEDAVGELTAAATWRRIEQLVGQTMRAAQPEVLTAFERLAPAGETPAGAHAGCFELFGFDVLCDARGTPWLLEVNQDPSLATDTQVDLEVKAKVLVDLLNLVGVGAGGDGATDEAQAPAESGWRPKAMAAPSDAHAGDTVRSRGKRLSIVEIGGRLTVGARRRSSLELLEESWPEFRRWNRADGAGGGSGGGCSGWHRVLVDSPAQQELVLPAKRGMRREDEAPTKDSAGERRTAPPSPLLSDELLYKERARRAAEQPFARCLEAIVICLSFR